MATPTYPHCKAAEKYAREVVGGTILANKWAKAACQRFSDDLARSKSDKSWPWVFSQEDAEKRCAFLEMLPHVKGSQWSGKKLKLQPWEQFLVANIYGFVHRTTGLRRFRSVYIEVARKNGKSFLAAGLCLAALVLDRELGAEVVTAATTRDQARVVFDVARRMCQMEPNFRAHFGVTVYEHSIVVEQDGSRMWALAAEGSNLDGKNLHFALADEMHAMKTRAVHDVLDSSFGSRTQPMLFRITTAGSDRGGVCYDVRLYIQKILNTTLLAHNGMGYRVEGNCQEDATAFGIIYSLDDADIADVFDEKNWEKSNPNLNVSVDIEDMRRQARMAKTQTAALSEFATKRLNLWWGADSGWLNRVEMDACVDSSLKEEQFAGERCFVGLDAAFKRDLFAKVKVFTKELDDGVHYYAFARHYTHEQMAEADGNEHIAGWAKDGWIHLSEGNVTDIAHVRDELIGAEGSPGDLQRFELAAVGYDPNQLTPFAAEMVDQGLPMVEVRPLVLNFSAPMKEIQELITAGRFHFNGDPVLAWCLSNVVCHVDAKSNVYPRKEREENKIDGAIALIMAMNRALLTRPDGPSYYESLVREHAVEPSDSGPEENGVTEPSPAVTPVLSYWEQVAIERLAKEKRESSADT